MSERLLLTGASGFIGSEVVELALAEGYEVLNLDIRPPRHAERREIWHELDIRDAARLETAIRDFAPDRVLHLASDVDITIATLAGFTSTIDGTANVLSAISKTPGVKRFVHTSTQMVVRPDFRANDERHLVPYTLYGQAKAETEKMVWDADLPIPWYIVRPVVIWGPYHPSFANEIFRYIADGRYLHPVGRSPILRAYGYVTNVAAQMMRFLSVDPAATSHHVYYVGDDNIDYDLWADAFSLALKGRRARRIPVELLYALGKIGDVTKRLRLPAPIDSGRAFRMSTPTNIDLASTLALTGPGPVSFDDGVERTVSWLRSLSVRQR